MIKILFICHGNICRSPMAQSVLTHLAAQAGVLDEFEIDSAATSSEEIGNPPHPGTVAKLRAEGVPIVPHRAVRMTRDDYEKYDYVICMDEENVRNVQRLSEGDPDEKIYKLLAFAGSTMDVADPWYTGDFEATYRGVHAAYINRSLTESQITKTLQRRMLERGRTKSRCHRRCLR
jgi:protein-tyrosine phosphatase